MFIGALLRNSTSFKLSLQSGHWGAWSKHRSKQPLQKVCPQGVVTGSKNSLKQSYWKLDTMPSFCLAKKKRVSDQLLIFKTNPTVEKNNPMASYTFSPIMQFVYIYHHTPSIFVLSDRSEQIYTKILILLQRFRIHKLSGSLKS